MIKVAITGGICSGKSTICKYIEELGYRVYYTDNIAKELIYNNKAIQQDIINEFSEESFIKGKYNTAFISNIVFKNQSKLDKLNAIFMPYIDENFKKICELNKYTDIIFYESALIFEHKKESDFEHIISVYADYNIVVSRLKSRNNYNVNMIKDRLQSQLSPFYKNTHADTIIDTSYKGWEMKLTETINHIKSNLNESDT